MKRFRHVFLLTVFAFGLSLSCDKYEDNNDIKECNLTLSEQTLIFECDADQSATVIVQSDKEWTINGITEGVRRWLDVEYTGAEGESVVQVNCIEANPFEEKRVAMLDFVIDGKVKSTLLVSQYSDPDRTVNLSVDRLDFSATSGGCSKILNANLCAVFLPIPGKRSNCEISSVSGIILFLDIFRINRAY